MLSGDKRSLQAPPEKPIALWTWLRGLPGAETQRCVDLQYLMQPRDVSLTLDRLRSRDARDKVGIQAMWKLACACSCCFFFF